MSDRYTIEEHRLIAQNLRDNVKRLVDENARLKRQISISNDYIRGVARNADNYLKANKES